MRKHSSAASDGQGSGLELSKQHEYAYKDKKPTIGDVEVEENPAYQSLGIIN